MQQLISLCPAQELLHARIEISLTAICELGPNSGVQPFSQLWIHVPSQGRTNPVIAPGTLVEHHRIPISQKFSVLIKTPPLRGGSDFEPKVMPLVLVQKTQKKNPKAIGKANINLSAYVAQTEPALIQLPLSPNPGGPILELEVRGEPFKIGRFLLQPETSGEYLWSLIPDPDEQVEKKLPIEISNSGGTVKSKMKDILSRASKNYGQVNINTTAPPPIEGDIKFHVKDKKKDSYILTVGNESLTAEPEDPASQLETKVFKYHQVLQFRSTPSTVSWIFTTPQGTSEKCQYITKDAQQVYKEINHKILLMANAAGVDTDQLQITEEQDVEDDPDDKGKGRKISFSTLKLKNPSQRKGAAEAFRPHSAPQQTPQSSIKNPSGPTQQSTSNTNSNPTGVNNSQPQNNTPTSDPHAAAKLSSRLRTNYGNQINNLHELYQTEGGGSLRPEPIPEEEKVEKESTPSFFEGMIEKVTNYFESDTNSNFSIETALEDDSSPDLIYKVIIIGDSGVGKTNLLNKWTRDKFDVSTGPTIGVEFSAKTFRVGGQVIKVQLWDTAGQEKHNAITTPYYRSAQGALLVYDITNFDSFNHMKSWLDRVRELSEDCCVLLIGNKVDNLENREVKKDRALNFAKENQINFLETSALDGSNVNIAFKMILQDIHSKIGSSMHQDGVKSAPVGQRVNVGAARSTQPQQQKEGGCCGN